MGMSGRRYVRLRRSINTMDGGVNMVCGVSFFLFVVIYLAIQLELARYTTTAFYLEDAICASCLAGAVIDVEEYGIEHCILIEDKECAYRLYCDALRENLGLDEKGECRNSSLLAGPIQVKCFVIYNVQHEAVEILSRTEEGSWHTCYGRLGEVTAPNGQVVESTGIYSEITCLAEGLFGCNFGACKGKLVDIVLR